MSCQLREDSGNIRRKRSKQGKRGRTPSRPRLPEKQKAKIKHGADEVTDIEFMNRSRRVRIVFDGGEIMLHDDYDRKLRSIYYRMLDGWEPPRRRED